MLAAPVAVAAHKLQRAVRCMLERDEDMIMTGTRHPFYAKYKVCTVVQQLYTSTFPCKLMQYGNDSMTFHTGWLHERREDSWS